LLERRHWIGTEFAHEGEKPQSKRMWNNGFDGMAPRLASKEKIFAQRQ
jgi:hypothetical protein